MCGIAALLCPASQPAAPLVTRMLAAVAHRGPDGDGTVCFTRSEPDLTVAPDGTVGLGHARLAIIDLSAAGHQPMSAGAGRWWLSFNGEIYNHLELRRELAGLGHTFVSHSDSEVLLHAWMEWGTACLPRLNGMFAFVVVDTRARRLWAVRDRFGIKPLYLWAGPQGHLALASEIKQFTVLPGWQARLDAQRAWDFLNWNTFDHTGRTLFAGVTQLRGGELLALDLTAAQPPVLPAPTRWYTLAADAQAATLDGRAAAHRFAELFEDSVRLQLRADVPVGSCLSGGLDSSSVVCTVRRLLDAAGATTAQHTFSARATVPAFDEGRWIDTVVQHAGVTSHTVFPDPDALFATLPQLTWHLDEPAGSTSVYAQWQVFALAHDAGLKVLLDGQGADEMLAGYHGFFGPLMASQFTRGRWGAVAGELRALRRLHGMPLTTGLARLADALLPDRVRQVLRAAAGRPAAGQNDWINLEVLGAMPDDPLVAAGARARTVAGLSRAQLVATHLPMLLHCEDRNAMAHGVEARVPFLDHRLVELALGLAAERKIGQGVTKRVLRDAMSGVLPEAVRTRTDKLGFVTPEEHWMRVHAPAAFRAQLLRAIEQSRGIVHPAVMRQWDQMQTGAIPFSNRWWRIIHFGAWIDRFAVALP